MNLSMQSTYLVFLVRLNDQKSQILATGVALLFALVINLLFTGLIQIFGSWTDGKAQFHYRFRDDVTRHMFLFGIACVLSCCSLPGLYGVYQTIMAWLCLIVLFALHALHVMKGDTMPKYRSIFTLVYYSLITAWFFGIMVSFFKLSTGAH